MELTEFRKKMRELGLLLYNKTIVCIDESTEPSDNLSHYYTRYCKLEDGRFVTYTDSCYYPEIEVNTKIKEDEDWDNEIGSYYYSESFIVKYRPTNGFLIQYSLFNVDNREYDNKFRGLSFIASDKGNCNDTKSLSEEEQKQILEFASNAIKQLPSMKFDRDKTFDPSNLTYNEQKRLIRIKVGKILDELKEKDTEKTTLPIIEAAVEWWIKYAIGKHEMEDTFTEWQDYYKAITSEDTEMFKVAKKRIEKFRNALTETIASKLSETDKLELSDEFYPCKELEDAMNKGNFYPKVSGARSWMTITPNEINVRLDDEEVSTVIYSEQPKYAKEKVMK